MPSVHSKNLEVYNAAQFKYSITEGTEGEGHGGIIYFTFGKPTPWVTETSPLVPSTSVTDYNQLWRNMVGGKRLTGNDVMHVIPRFNWTFGDTYTAYDDLADSKALKNANTKFYVVTDDFHVYKCIANNKGAASIVKPTLTPTGTVFQTADKYIWRYMYTISVEDQQRFMSNEFIPVKTLTIPDGTTQWAVQNTTVSGAIHSIVVENGGTNYTADNMYVQVIGDGVGANAFAVRNASTNTISEIIIDDEGRGYTRANVFVINPSDFSPARQARARAIISPSGGHGSDPLIELGGSYIMISVQMRGTEGGKFSVANDFRQVSLIENPLKKGTSNSFTNLSFSQTTTVAVSGVSVNYQKDEYVYQGNSFRYSTYRGTVVEWDSVTNTLKLIGTDGNPTNDKLFGYTSAAVRQLVSVTVQPELEPNSGKLLYIDNIQPLQRDASQTEDFKIVLSF